MVESLLIFLSLLNSHSFLKQLPPPPPKSIPVSRVPLGSIGKVADTDRLVCPGVVFWKQLNATWKAGGREGFQPDPQGDPRKT